MEVGLARTGHLPRQHGRRAARGSPPSRRETLRRQFGDGGLAAALMLGLFGLVLLLGVGGAVFSSTTAGPAATLTAGSLNGYVPTAVSASRTAATTCLVSWTPVASPPAGLTYDVTDGAGSTVATAVTGTSTSVTVPATAVTPTVRARIGAWVSATATTAAAPCRGFPDAPPGLTLTPSDGALTATWTAPAGNGGTLASYTATISPAPGTGSATCSVTATTTTCSWSALTNGQAYVVSVTATSDVGTGPAASATTWPYPSGVMSPANLRLWLDGADTATLFTSSGCIGAVATTTAGCWKDKSPQANHAVQASTGRRPTLGTVNGRTAVSFDGTDDALTLDPTLLPTGSTPSTILATAALTDPAPNSNQHRSVITWGAPEFGQARGLWKGWFDAAVAGGIWSATYVTQGTWDGTAQVAALEHNSPAVTVWAGGRASGSTSNGTGAYSTGTTHAAVGGFAGVFFWQGPIPEVVVLGTTVTAAQRRSVEEYLARKWGSTITPQAPTAVNGTATTATSTSANVAWTAPAWNGGSAVTSYTATAVPTAGGSTVTCTATAPATTCTLAGLAGGGAQYSVTVAAANPAGTGPASATATVFSGVPSAASVKLWLAADDLDADGAQAGVAESGLVSGAVQTWKDKSGGARDVTAPSAAERPPYGTYTLGGYRVPTFGGSTVLTGSGTNPYGITGDRSLFVVTRQRTVDASTTYLVDRTPQQNQIFSLLACSGTWSVQRRNDAGSGLGCVSGGSSPTVNRVDVVAGQRTGTTDSARVSGAPGSTSTLSGPITQNAVSVGRHASSLGSFDLDIAEVLLYDTSLSGSQRRAVEKYLADKWGGALAPDVPTAVSATAAGVSGQASVTWTAPADIGGSALTLHTARTISGGFSCTATAPATSCTLSGLTNGTSYTVYVESTNGTGTGDRSATTTVTPAVVPGAPTAVAATNGDTTSSVSWTAPASNGGSAVTGYTATAVPSDGTLPNVTCTSATSPCTLTGLANGITYTVTVVATNAIGSGPASASTTSSPYPSAIMTTALTSLWLDAADSSTRFADTGCTTPAGAGVGSAVSCWRDRSTNARNAVASTAASVGTTMNGRMTIAFDGAAQLTVPSPVSGDTTIFAVPRTTQTVGSPGDLSFLGAPLLDADVPSAANDYGFTLVAGRPTFGTGNPNVSVSGPVTANNGAAQVVVARRNVGALEASTGAGTRGSATSSNTGPLNAPTVAYLGTSVNGLFYIGDYGELVVLSSALSRTDERIVLEYLARKWGAQITPQAPSGVTATGGQNAQSTVSWTPPAWNGGSAVTSYTVTASPGGLTCTTASTSCTVTALTNGTAYTFTVTAANTMGSGPSSAASTAVTPS